MQSEQRLETENEETNHASNQTGKISAKIMSSMNDPPNPIGKTSCSLPNRVDKIKESPHNLSRAIGEIFFVRKRRENAGILDVF